MVSLEKRKVEVDAEIEALSDASGSGRSRMQTAAGRRCDLRTEADQSAPVCLKIAEESYARKAGRTAREGRDAKSKLPVQNCCSIRLLPSGCARLRGSLKGRWSGWLSRQKALAREGERAATQHAERKAEADAFSARLMSAREHIATLNAERERAVDAVVQGHEAVSDTEAELTRVRDEYSRTQHRLESLKELDDRRAYYSSAVQLMFAQTSRRATSTLSARSPMRLTLKPNGNARSKVCLVPRCSRSLFPPRMMLLAPRSGCGKTTAVAPVFWWPDCTAAATKSNTLACRSKSVPRFVNLLRH